MAERMKAEKKQIAIASLRDCPTSPRKMRIVADTIRGVEVKSIVRPVDACPITMSPYHGSR